MGRIVVNVYVLMIFVFAIYGNWWGAYAYKGFAYNLGRSLIWPTIIIPGLGQVIGAIVLVAIIGFLTMGRK